MLRRMKKLCTLFGRGKPAAARLFTSESVSEGHPDKVADRISDAILDAYLTADPAARVAAEVLVTENRVVIAGEKRSHAQINVEEVARHAIAAIGYTPQTSPSFNLVDAVIENRMNEQSAQIAQGVDAADASKSEGAGDQGLMFGFACDETPDLMPAPIFYAHSVLQTLSEWRRSSSPHLRPDAKSQITVAYQNGKPSFAHTLLISHQHAPELPRSALEDLVKQAWHTVLPQGWITPQTRFLVNPTGAFTEGGPACDTGLTGRKIIVDTYGGMARHGGGAFSGKDCTKVDRSAAYMARYLAKNVVAAGLAKRCEIQLAYAIGVAEPLAVYVETFGTGQKGLQEADVARLLPELVDLTPRGLRERFALNRPIFTATSSYGHFGRAAGSAGKNSFGWEATDLAEILRKKLA